MDRLAYRYGRKQRRQARQKNPQRAWRPTAWYPEEMPHGYVIIHADTDKNTFVWWSRWMTEELV